MSFLSPHGCSLLPHLSSRVTESLTPSLVSWTFDLCFSYHLCSFLMHVFSCLAFLNQTRWFHAKLFFTSLNRAYYLVLVNVLTKIVSWAWEMAQQVNLDPQHPGKPSGTVAYICSLSTRRRYKPGSQIPVVHWLVSLPKYG